MKACLHANVPVPQIMDRVPEVETDRHIIILPVFLRQILVIRATLLHTTVFSSKCWIFFLTCNQEHSLTSELQSDLQLGRQVSVRVLLVQTYDSVAAAACRTEALVCTASSCS